MSQADYFSSLKQPTPQMTYDNCFTQLNNIKNFGRFTLFIYIEMINVLTDYNLKPTYLDLRQAESCRNGLVEHLGKEELYTHKNDRKLSKNQINYLQYEFKELMKNVNKYDYGIVIDVLHHIGINNYNNVDLSIQNLKKKCNLFQS